MCIPDLLAGADAKRRFERLAQRRDKGFTLLLGKQRKVQAARVCLCVQEEGTIEVMQSEEVCFSRRLATTTMGGVEVIAVDTR